MLQRRQLKFKQPALLRDWTRFVSKALRRNISKPLTTVAHTHGTMMKYSQGSTIPHGLTMLGLPQGFKQIIMFCALGLFSPSEYYFGNIESQYEITSTTMKTIRSRVSLPNLLWIGTNCIRCGYFRTRQVYFPINS